MSTRSRSRSAIENVDVAAATFVVGDDLQIADFATILQAILNLPTEGGKIFCLQGSHIVSSTITLPDANVTIELASGAEIDASALGANPLFKVPDGLTQKRVYRVSGAEKIFGGNVAGQSLVEQADANSRGTVYFTDIQEISDFRRIVYQSAGSAVFVQNDVVRAFFTRCKIIPPVDGAVLAQTANPAGTYAYPAALYLEDTQFWSEIAPGQKGWTFDYDGDILCEGYVSGTIKGACKCDGLTTSGVVFALNGATADGTDSLEALGVTYDSGDEIGNAFLDNVILKFSATSFLINDPGLSSRAKIILNAVGLSVVSPRIFFSLADPDVRIDVLAGADSCEIRGGRLGNASTALIRTAAQKLRVNGCSLNATGGANTVLDSGAGDYTLVVECEGDSTGAGLSLAANSSVNGARLASKSAASTNAFVDAVATIANPKGLQGVGWVKNTGGANGITVRETFTDAFGTSSTLDTNVAFGDTLPLSLGIAIGTGLPPYVSYQVQVKDQVNGNHSNYVVQFTSQGAV